MRFAPWNHAQEKSTSEADRGNQRIISNRQIATKRREQELALGPKKQQIASAFIDEIDAILSELHHEFLKPIENALRAMESRAGKIDVGSRPRTHR
jgi:hypothetical protein